MNVTFHILLLIDNVLTGVRFSCHVMPESVKNNNNNK